MHKCEEIFEKKLKKQFRLYDHQPKGFQMGRIHYRADFYCYDNDTYYEVVGTRQALSKLRHKITKLIETKPNIKIRIVKPDGHIYIDKEDLLSHKRRSSLKYKNKYF